MRKSIATFALACLLSSSRVFAAELPSESLYELPVQLVDQQGRTQSLALHRGHLVLVAMFYGSCPNVCPLLIESIKSTENALTAAARKDVRVLMISIDPERDTPTALAKLASMRRLDASRWTLAHVSEDDVRLVAAALGVQYRKLPNGDYNHSSSITLLSPDGVIVKQTSQLGKADPLFVGEVEKIAKR